MRAFIQKHPILVYLAIAYVFSGTLWTLGLRWPDTPLYTLAVYGPLLAALVVAGARGRVVGLLKSAANVWVSPKWYLFIAAFAIGINIPSVAVSVFTGGWHPAYSIGGVMVLFATQLVTSGLEEPGWRGFLLPELLRRHAKNPSKAGWFSGLAWAVWHFPMTIPLYWAMGPTALLPSLAGFVMAICGTAFVYSWMYQRTQNVWLAIVMHAAMNTAQLYLIGTTQNPATAILPVLTTWAVVWVLEKFWPSRMPVRIQ